MPRMQFPLIAQGTQRTRSDSTKDSYIKNMYITKEGATFILNKRPPLIYFGEQANTYIAGGLFSLKLSPLKTSSTTQSLMLKWDGTDWDLYLLQGANPAIFQASVPSFSGDNNNFLINWAEAGDGKIAFTIGNLAFIWDMYSPNINEISDTDFLIGTAGLVYLDGYLFASDGLSIYNSGFTGGVHDPFVWAALDFITPQSMNTTGLLKIAHHQNNIVAFGPTSIEFFYNAGNPVGTPLAPRRDLSIPNVGLLYTRPSSGITPVGGLPAYTDIDGGQTGAFLSHTTGGIVGVHLLSNFQIIKISDDRIDKYLNYNETVDNPRHHTIHTIIINGKVYLLLGIRSYISSTEIVKSFLYDLELNLWIEWIVDTNLHTSGAFNIIASAPLYSSGSFSSTPLGSFVQFIDGKIYLLDSGALSPVYRDYDSSSTYRNISVSIQTPKFRGQAGEHAASKFMTELSLIGDRGASTNNVSVEYTDNDYQTYSTARNLDVSVADKRLTQLGTFQERAFRLTHTANLPLRLEHAEIEYNTGR